MAKASGLFIVTNRAGATVYGPVNRAAARQYAASHGGMRAGLKTNEWTVRTGTTVYPVEGKYKDYLQIDDRRGPITYRDVLKLLASIPNKHVHIAGKGLMYGDKSPGWRGGMLDKDYLRGVLLREQKAGKPVMEALSAALDHREPFTTLEAVQVSGVKDWD